jgi:hypothetical protein
MTGPPHQPVPWTLDEAASFLRPTVTADQLRRIFAHLPAMNPISRRASTGGRGADEYDMDEVIEWHHLNRRWLVHPDLS